MHSFLQRKQEEKKATTNFGKELLQECHQLLCAHWAGWGWPARDIDGKLSHNGDIMTCIAGRWKQWPRMSVGVKHNPCTKSHCSSTPWKSSKIEKTTHPQTWPNSTTRAWWLTLNFTWYRPKRRASVHENEDMKMKNALLQHAQECNLCNWIAWQWKPPSSQPHQTQQSA